MQLLNVVDPSIVHRAISKRAVGSIGGKSAPTGAQIQIKQPIIMSDTSSVRERERDWKNTVEKMRERLKNRADTSMFEGIRDDKLYHGLKLTSSTLLIGTFTEICYCTETQEYLVLDAGATIHRYSMQGKPIRPSYPLSATMLFTRMIWCPGARVSACYIPHDDLIWIVTVSCKLLQVVRNEFRIEELFYSSTTNEIIVVGTNKLTRYPMHDTDHPLNSLPTLSYLDSALGAMWHIECSSLIESSTNLSLAGSYLTTIYVMSAEPESSRQTEAPVDFTAKRSGATRSAITALCYHRISSWIISGDEVGDVHAWSLQLECTMSCPGGHNGLVRAISSHPSICGFITCSDDNVLQVWSCNLRGKVESFEDIGDIWRIAINEAATSVATLGTKLNCFHMNQLYVFYAPLTAQAAILHSTTNPTFPTRIIVASTDNTVRMLSSRTGKQMNVQLLSPRLEVVGVAYSGITDRMYTIILKTGEILVSSSRTNPMKLKHVWVNDEWTITCIVAYESFEKVRSTSDERKIIVSPISTRIIAGTAEGKLVIIEETSGKHETAIAAHEGPVMILCCSTLSRQVVSVGGDKCVKVWRVFSDLKIPLALVCSVYHTVPITLVASMGATVCTVSSTEGAKAHPLFMYDTSERIRLDHHPSKDHSALVVAIATSESLRVCASSSLDKTIRIWDSENDLLKILEICTCAWNIAFSSLRGDIVFGAGRHLYRIPYENYLSPKYRARLIVEEIPEYSDEEEIPESSDYRVYEEEVDREKALHPVSSTPFGSLGTKSSDGPRLELMLLEQTCLNLQYRDEDVLRIKDGAMRGTRLVADKSILSSEAWDRHINELLDTSSKSVKDLPTHNFWANVDKHAGVRRTCNEPGLCGMLKGYGVGSFTDYPRQPREELVESSRLRMFGFLPNSLIYKIRDEPTKQRTSPQPKRRTFKYQYPPDILLGEQREDPEDEPDVPLTLSQLADLGGEEITGE